MALPFNFTRTLPSNELLFAYNNNVVEFESSNNLGLNSLRCLVYIGYDVYEIYPNTLNVFRFNFREAFQKIINQNHFADDKVLNVTALKTSCIIQNNIDTFSDRTVTYKIFLENGTFEQETKTLRFIKGVENLQNFTNRKLLLDSGNNDFHLLTPFVKASDRAVSLTYFEGFPFDVPYYSHEHNDIVVTRAGGNFDNFVFPPGAGRFVISDGNQTIEQFITLTEGANPLSFGVTVPIILNLKKVSGGCGTYLKWINKYGLWNYWLFNNRDETQLETRDAKSLFNDFDGLEDNPSPFLEIGKMSKERIVLNSTNVTADEMEYLKFLFESPKVYLYTIEDPTEFTGTENDFIEVKLKGNKLITDNYRGSSFNVRATIELPARNTMTL